MGRGFNDYRSGYNGGTLSSGKIRSVGATHGPALRALKRQSKSCLNQHQSKNFEAIDDGSKKYIANAHQIEGTGGGCLANTPLSMHSEMMAINSALSLSANSTCQVSARSKQWLQRPCYKLPSRSKRQARLRSLKAYADAVYSESSSNSTTSKCCGPSHIQGSSFEPCPNLLQGVLQGGQDQQGGPQTEVAAAAAAATSGAARTEGQSCQFRGVSKIGSLAWPRGLSERETPEKVPVRHTTGESPISPEWRPSSSLSST